MRLENWSVTSEDSTHFYFQGNVYEHPRLKDGLYIHTTRVIGCGHDGVFITKSGSHYTLGEVDKEYEKAFPNARERLYTSAKEVFKNE